MKSMEKCFDIVCHLVDQNSVKLLSHQSGPNLPCALMSDLFNVFLTVLQDEVSFRDSDLRSSFHIYEDLYINW